MRTMGERALLAGFGLAVAAMFVVDAVSSRRTTSLRKGRSPPTSDRSPRAPSSGGRTSRTTFLPGLAGAALALDGGLVLAGGRPGGLLLLIPGAVVAGFGFRARITFVSAGPNGLRLHYPRRSPFVAQWPTLVALSPPRVWFAGWRVRTLLAGRTLMPSDVLGHEEVLQAIVEWAGFDFDGRSWSRQAASARENVDGRSGGDVTRR
jgi:hypothetical protein